MADAAGAPGVVGITHTGLSASDCERTLRFYTEGLGFEIADGYDSVTTWRSWPRSIPRWTAARRC